MTKPANSAKVLAMLALAGSGLAPAVARGADTGGTSADGAGRSGATGAGAPDAAQAGGTDVAQADATNGARADGYSLVAVGAWLGGTAQFRGSVGAGGAGRDVTVERFSPRKRLWVATVRTRADRRGSFVASWQTSEAGRFEVRALVGSTHADTAQVTPAAGRTALTVYRPAVATWYGPGFYGRRTACGQRMSRSLIGIASRTLACGTKVEISYRGRALTAPVVDRGPYTSASWDLTSAAAQALGFTGRQRIGTLVVGR